MGLAYRMDVRELADYKTDIKQYTVIEQHFGKALQLHFTEAGWPCTVGEYGVDNSGDVIYDELPNFNPDKIYTFAKDGCTFSQKVEIKSWPETKSQGLLDKMTFKVSALKGTLCHQAVLVVPTRNEFFYFPEKAMNWMLQRLPVRTDLKPWGYKPVVVLPTQQAFEMVRNNYVIHCAWKPKAFKYVDQHDHILFASRESLQPEKAA